MSDSAVRASSRSFVRRLRDAGVPLDSVHRYNVAWVPQFVMDFAPKNFGVTHAMDRPIHVSSSDNISQLMAELLYHAWPIAARTKGDGRVDQGLRGCQLRRANH